MSAPLLIFTKHKVCVWLKFNTETTGTVQKTSDCTVPVGDSPEKELFSPNGYLAQGEMQWRSDKTDCSSGGKTMLQGLTVKFGLYCNDNTQS